MNEGMVSMGARGEVTKWLR